MEYRTLGATGWLVSVIGIGGGGIGQVWGPTTEEESIRAVHRALELGINFFDVAPGYGNGKAEEVLGRALRGRTEPAYVATKVRLGPNDFDDIPGALRRGFEASLGRLGRDRVDLLQLHNHLAAERQPPGRIAIGDALGPVLETLERFRAEGLTSAIGFTGYGEYDAVVAMIRSGRFATVQLHYNPLHPNAITIDGDRPLGADGTLRPALFGLAREHGLGIIGIRPLAAGALSESVDREVREGSPLARDLARIDSFRFLIRSASESFSQAALRYVVQNPAIATTIPGIKNVSEVDDAVAALDLPPYSESDLARVVALT